jgi:lactoylglutathione lyase
MSGTTRITGVGTVGVPVTDQDRALECYVDKLGFEKRRDLPLEPAAPTMRTSRPAASTSTRTATAGSWSTGPEPATTTTAG